MKKVLFATTALVASAGIASAEVAISGSAEMGIVGGDRYNDTQFFQSVDVRFTMTGETDSGLTFGATIDLEDAVDTARTGADLVDSRGFSDYTVFVSGSFGTLTMGDTDGAFDWAMRETNIVGGSIDDSETAHSGFNGNAGLDGVYDGQIVRYNYSFSGFAIAVSAELNDGGAGDPALGVGATYSGDFGGVNMRVGFGYQSNSAFDIMGVSLSGSSAGFSAALNYSDLDGYRGNESHMGIGVGYTMDAVSIGLNYGSYDRTVGADRDGYGLAVNYDLGGGAVVQFGYSDGSNNQSSFSLGLAMSF